MIIDSAPTAPGKDQRLYKSNNGGKFNIIMDFARKTPGKDQRLHKSNNAGKFNIITDSASTAPGEDQRLHKSNNAGKFNIITDSASTAPGEDQRLHKSNNAGKFNTITDSASTAPGKDQRLHKSNNAGKFNIITDSASTAPGTDQSLHKTSNGRFFSKRLQDYEFVIAHYNENLDWLAPRADHAHVYHKGTDLQPPPMELYAWEKLPNVGRESHTYLHHIIHNYDNLPEVTVFLQGEKLSYFCFSTPEDYLINIKKNITCKPLGPQDNWGRIHHIGKWLNELNSGVMRRAKSTLGDFFQELFGFPHPPGSFTFCPAGCFAATRHMIRKHPIEFYKKAITFVNDHPNPEEGHYFERMWPTIFS